MSLSTRTHPILQNSYGCPGEHDEQRGVEDTNTPKTEQITLGQIPEGPEPEEPEPEESVRPVLTCETLVAHGGHDDPLPRAVAESMARLDSDSLTTSTGIEKEATKKANEYMSDEW